MPAHEPKRLFISDLISLATIELHLRGRQRDDVLTELVAKIPEIADRSEARQNLPRALAGRETLQSTGLRHGLRPAHAPHAPRGLRQKPVVRFGQHGTG